MATIDEDRVDKDRSPTVRMLGGYSWLEYAVLQLLSRHGGQVSMKTLRDSIDHGDIGSTLETLSERLLVEYTDRGGTDEQTVRLGLLGRDLKPTLVGSDERGRTKSIYDKLWGFHKLETVYRAVNQKVADVSNWLPEPAVFRADTRGPDGSFYADTVAERTPVRLDRRVPPRIQDPYYESLLQTENNYTLGHELYGLWERDEWEEKKRNGEVTVGVVYDQRARAEYLRGGEGTYSDHVENMREDMSDQQTDVEYRLYPENFPYSLAICDDSVMLFVRTLEEYEDERLREGEVESVEYEREFIYFLKSTVPAARDFFKQEVYDEVVSESGTETLDQESPVDQVEAFDD